MNMGETNLKWQYNRYDGTLNTASKKRCAINVAI